MNIELIDDLTKKLDEKTIKRLNINKIKRIIIRLKLLQNDCEDCKEYLDVIENHLIKLSIEINKDILKTHYEIIKRIITHLHNKHKLVEKGYYTSIYMAIGMSMGTSLGLFLQNLVIGASIGMLVGLSIGALKDDETKKKGLII